MIGSRRGARKLKLALSMRWRKSMSILDDLTRMNLWRSMYWRTSMNDHRRLRRIPNVQKGSRSTASPTNTEPITTVVVVRMDFSVSVDSSWTESRAYLDSMQ
jgi:hypothetical protein